MPPQSVINTSASTEYGVRSLESQTSTRIYVAIHHGLSRAYRVWCDIGQGSIWHCVVSSKNIRAPSGIRLNDERPTRLRVQHESCDPLSSKLWRLSSTRRGKQVQQPAEWYPRKKGEKLAGKNGDLSKEVGNRGAVTC